MVIQRLQSLFLLLAGIVLCFMCICVPVANVPAGVDANSSTVLYVKDMLPMLIISAAATVLIFVDIFLFKNLPLQMKVTKLIMLLVVASMIVGGVMLSSRMPAGADVIWWGVTAMMIVALVLVFLSYRRMKADHKLLKSYDRLR